jgi:DNA-binding protein HU-beta
LTTAATVIYDHLYRTLYGKGGEIMFKTELIGQVAKETRLSRRVVADVLEASQAAIRGALGRGQEVQLPGFGTFYTRERPEGTVRRFGAAETVHVPARRVAAFRVGEVLKRAVRKERKRRRLFGV